MLTSPSRTLTKPTPRAWRSSKSEVRPQQCGQVDRFARRRSSAPYCGEPPNEEEQNTLRRRVARARCQVLIWGTQDRTGGGTVACGEDMGLHQTDREHRMIYDEKRSGNRKGRRRISSAGIPISLASGGRLPGLTPDLRLLYSGVCSRCTTRSSGQTRPPEFFSSLLWRFRTR